MVLLRACTGLHLVSINNSTCKHRLLADLTNNGICMVRHPINRDSCTPLVQASINNGICTLPPICRGKCLNRGKCTHHHPASINNEPCTIRLLLALSSKDATPQGHLTRHNESTRPFSCRSKDKLTRTTHLETSSHPEKAEEGCRKDECLTRLRT